MEQIRRYNSTKKRNTSLPLPTDREIRRVVRLASCMVILVMAVSVKLLFPNAIQGVRAKALEILGGDVDYEAALTVMGEAVAGEKGLREAMTEAYEFAFKITDGTEEAIEADSEAVVPEAESEIDSEIPEQDVEIIEEDVVISEDNDVPMIQNLSYIHEGEDTPPDGASYTMANIGFDYCMPVSGKLTSSYGYRNHPVDGGVKFHYGTDFGASEGTDILAFGDGTVYAIGESATLGLYVMIDHANDVRTTYGHCSKLLVSSGDSVKMGQKIAEMGSTGNATGSCLHFEIEVDGVNVDPEYYLTWV